MNFLIAARFDSTSTHLTLQQDVYTKESEKVVYHYVSKIIEVSAISLSCHGKLH